MGREPPAIGPVRVVAEQSVVGRLVWKRWKLGRNGYLQPPRWRETALHLAERDVYGEIAH